MCSIWGIPVLWSGCWLCTPTKSSFTRSCSGDGSFLKRTLEPRNLAAFSISAFNYRVTMNRIDKGHAEKRGKNHQFVKIKEIMWKQKAESISIAVVLCILMICAFFNLKTTHQKLNLEESYERIFSPKKKMESHTTNPWYVVGDKRTTASPAHSLRTFYLRTSQ